MSALGAPGAFAGRRARCSRRPVEGERGVEVTWRVVVHWWWSVVFGGGGCMLGQRDVSGLFCRLNFFIHVLCGEGSVVGGGV